MKQTYFEMYARLKAIRDNLYLTESLVDEQWISSKVSAIETLLEQLGAHIEEAEPLEMIDEI